MDDTDWWPTAFLQFVYKDGRYVLQQKWILPDPAGKGEPKYEWRDVPTADATQA